MPDNPQAAARRLFENHVVWDDHHLCHGGLWVSLCLRCLCWTQLLQLRVIVQKKICQRCQLRVHQWALPLLVVLHPFKMLGRACISSETIVVSALVQLSSVPLACACATPI